MPLFNLTPEEREAVVTVILSMVKEKPPLESVQTLDAAAIDGDRPATAVGPNGLVLRRRLNSHSGILTRDSRRQSSA